MSVTICHCTCVSIYRNDFCNIDTIDPLYSDRPVFLGITLAPCHSLQSFYGIQLTTSASTRSSLFATCVSGRKGAFQSIQVYRSTNTQCVKSRLAKSDLLILSIQLLLVTQLFKLCFNKNGSLKVQSASYITFSDITENTDPELTLNSDSKQTGSSMV